MKDKRNNGSRRARAHRAQATRPRPNPRSSEEIAQLFAQLCDHYGIDHSPDRDRSRDGDRTWLLLYWAARDRLLRSPPKKGGAPPKWKGKLGLELVEAVDAIRAKPVPRGERQLNHYRRRMKTDGGVLTDELFSQGFKLLSVKKAIETLQEQQPDKWGRYDARKLEKRYGDAIKIWPFAKRVVMTLLPSHWRPFFPEYKLPEN